MRRLLASAILTGLGLALPLWAFAQTTPPLPVIPPVHQAAHSKKTKATSAPVWQHGGNTLSVTASSQAGTTVPTGLGNSLDGRAHSTAAGVRLATKPGITAHANVREIRWAPLAPICTAAFPGVPAQPACVNPLFDGIESGEVGAGFAMHGMQFDLSVGQSQSQPAAAAPALANRHSTILPRVLPAEDGADVAAPLWFRDSTTTHISARGKLDLDPDTSVKLGASVGRVKFLPGFGLAGDDNALDQTTLSLGIQRGAVRGAIVGHMLEPAMPGTAFDGNERWSGIDLGISVRLPWRGELNFGARNMWTFGHAPLLFGPGAALDQGRVPYVQYHQDL
ncbi:MAG: hypothetical protein ACREPK_12075 [Rhodanobacteraceae bacterium]